MRILEYSLRCVYALACKRTLSPSSQWRQAEAEKADLPQFDLVAKDTQPSRTYAASCSLLMFLCIWRLYSNLIEYNHETSASVRR